MCQSNAECIEKNTSTFILEGIVRERITSHLIKHKLISPSQHGFVKEKTCVTNLLECQNVVSGLLMKTNRWMYCTQILKKLSIKFHMQN